MYSFHLLVQKTYMPWDFTKLNLFQVTCVRVFETSEIISNCFGSPCESLSITWFFRIVSDLSESLRYPMFIQIVSDLWANHHGLQKFFQIFSNLWVNHWDIQCSSKMFQISEWIIKYHVILWNGFRSQWIIKTSDVHKICFRFEIRFTKKDEKVLSSRFCWRFEWSYGPEHILWSFLIG